MSLASIRGIMAVSTISDKASRPLTSRIRSYVAPKFNICSKSRGVLVILLCNFIVGVSRGVITYGVVGITLASRGYNDFFNVVFIMLGVYALFGFIQVFYPIGGLLSDVWCGRYKVVSLSFFSIWCGLFLMTIVGIIFDINNRIDDRVTITLGGCTFIILLVGFSGFQANAVQFGLDQLLEAPSHELSTFLHWYIWMEHFGETMAYSIITAASCSKHFMSYVSIFPIIFTIISTVLLVLSYFRGQWFRCEQMVYNPYGTVYRVLKFVLKHNQPIRRSALTYSDDERPTRIEFAKERFGGPFTTAVVEDVKTIMKILLMLLALSPIFYLQVSTKYLYPILGLHLGRNLSVRTTGCTYGQFLLQFGNLSFFISLIILPLYMVFIYPHFTKWFPRIVHRLGMGMVISVLSTCSMFTIQTVASYSARENGVANVSCMFLAEYRDSKPFHLTQTLHFPTFTLIVPSVLNGIAKPLISISILEFISAQSPHTMKGLLLGIFYALRGFYIMLGCAFTFPFALPNMWNGFRGILDCGFWYYLHNTIFGVMSLVLAFTAIRWYQYREREDQPYGPRYVEDYYHRYIERTATWGHEDERFDAREDNTNYGTINSI